MNKFKKYCPNVWIAECDDRYEKGDIITLETKYGKEVECEVYNLVAERDGKYYYSIVRIEDQTYAQRKAERHRNSAASNTNQKQSLSRSVKRGQRVFVAGRAYQGRTP